MTTPLKPISVPILREDLCLEFANTRYWRGSDPATETMHGIDDVLNWSVKLGASRRSDADDLARRWREQPRQAAAAFEDAIALREAIYRIFSAGAAAKKPTNDDLAALNEALAQAPGRIELHRANESYSWRIASPRPTMSHVLAPVLWSAGDLLVGPRLAKVRACANEKCRWLFLDDSKSGTRRWCSMSMCGNRAKAHRHYARQKG
jgi:predicted RNA-binding Zn ribbon-like protein